MQRKKIILAISGGISAYKIPVLVRLLIKNEIDVQVLLTKKASKFVSRIVLETLSQKKVFSDFFEDSQESWVKHIEVANSADALIIVPATANTIAKLANGFSHDVVSTMFVAFSTRKPRIIAPAMDGEMFQSAFVQENISKLRKQGCILLDPDYGELASGLKGIGRMPEPDKILSVIKNEIALEQIFKDKHVVITASGTRENIDDVRFISNYATGKMGFALARSALKMGAKVTLITGKSCLQSPIDKNFTRVNVITSDEMYNATMKYFPNADLFIAAAAVSDYKPKQVFKGKIKKKQSEISISLVRTRDILKQVGEIKNQAQVVVGFALEIENYLQNAKAKLKEKNCDMIILNVLTSSSGFESDTNECLLLTHKGDEKLELMPKSILAEKILQRIKQLFFNKS